MPHNQTPGLRLQIGTIVASLWLSPRRRLTEHSRRPPRATRSPGIEFQRRCVHASWHEATLLRSAFVETGSWIFVGWFGQLSYQNMPTNDRFIGADH